MKNISYILLFLFITYSSVFSQGINYQGTLINKDSKDLSNTDIIMLVEILSGGISGAVVYSEKHNTKTLDNGIFNIVIGEGTPESGIFKNIEWGKGNYYILTKVSINGDLYNMPATKLNYVPYTFFSKTSDKTTNTFLYELIDVDTTLKNIEKKDSLKILIWDGEKWSKSNTKINEIALLNENKSIDASYLPKDIVTGNRYLGLWNPLADSPNLRFQGGKLIYGILEAQQGDYFSVSKEDPSNSFGICPCKPGDKVYANTLIGKWEKVNSSFNIGPNTIKTEHIINGQVKTEDLADDVITSEKIKDLSIKEVDIADNQITSSKIKDYEIKSNNIADGAINTDAIKDGSVTLSKLAEGSIDGSKIKINTIDATKIKEKTITSDLIVPGHIIASLIENGAITNEKIQAGAITNEKIKDSTIEGDKIKNGSITNEKLAPLSIKTDNIKNNQITSDKIINGTIVADDIKDGEITGDKIKNAAITTIKIADFAITKEKLAVNTIDSSKIINGSISSIHIKKNSIDETAIIDSSITGAKIKLNTITGDRIKEKAIITKHLQEDIINTSHIIDGSIEGQDIGRHQLRAIHLAEHSIVGSNNTISGFSSHFQPGTISTRDIAHNSITNELIRKSSITNNKIQDGAIKGSKLSDNLRIVQLGVGTENAASGEESLIVGTSTSTPAIKVYYNISSPSEKLVDYVVGGNSIGGVSYSGGTLTYTPFTGSHLGKSDYDIKKPTVVCFTNTEENYEKGKEPIYSIEPCKEYNSNKVAGVVMTKKNKKEQYYIDAVGNGFYPIIQKGNEKIGDYLVSSSTEGYAEKYNTDLTENNVIGRLSENINWAKIKTILPNGKKYTIANVTFHFFRLNKTSDKIDKKIIQLKSELESLKKEIKNLYEK